MIDIRGLGGVHDGRIIAVIEPAIEASLIVGNFMTNKCKVDRLDLEKSSQVDK